MSKRSYLPGTLLALGFILMLLPSAAAAQEQTGSPVSGVDVSLENKSGGGNVSARTDAEGNFSFSGLQPGAYRLRMSCKDCKYEGASDGAQKYLFYVTVEGIKGSQFKRSVDLYKMRSGVEYTVKVVEGTNGEVRGRVTGAWDKQKKKIKPPTIKPPTE